MKILKKAFKKNFTYNYGQKYIKKYLVDNLGKVVEEDDKLICYVKKIKLKRKNMNIPLYVMEQKTKNLQKYII